ncbi:MAG: preprotein translocase subunit SecY [Verrucomicrobia bacterium]|nr:preprotein translocase subunit SecY [Verrucomicrobiota bacterium]
MIDGLKRVFRVPELRERLFFTFLMLVIYRLAVFVPVPGINGEIALSFFRNMSGGGQNLFQLVDIFSGSAFSQMTVVALGVMPYISASIIMQLVTALVPTIQRELRENPNLGKRKISKWTRLMAVGLAFIQAALFARYALQMNLARPGIVMQELLDITAFGTPWLFYLLVIATMTAGTTFLMWIGEQITEKGIGNGISLIIAVSILSSVPTALGTVVTQLNLDGQGAGQMSFTSLVVLCAVFVFIAVGTILVIQGQRRIPLQYARRVVGRKEVQGGNAYIPLKINYAGVIPVIFASALLMFPATIAQFLGTGNWLGSFAAQLTQGSWIYTALYVALILFFTYFWTATQFNPEQIASDMKRNGAFIPGIRQGRPTQDYLEQTMNRITIIGAVFLAIIAILPQLIGGLLEVSPTVSYFFGGTPLLILVGVVLDTMRQIESHLVMKRYDGFMKRGRIRGR